MKVTNISSCYLGPQISPEQFVAEHMFLYLMKGTITGYDGHKKHILKPGQYCMVRRNHLARYSKQADDDKFGKVVVIFDEAFLKDYQQKYKIAAGRSASPDVFVGLKESPLVHKFVQSLEPYYNGEGKIDEVFAQVKREELLLILLQANAGLGDMLFDFGLPGKLDLEAFMNNNYKFNVSIDRFAYLTGRSISSFKRDFKQIFNDTPSHWLIQKRLTEAYFLIEKKRQKPSDIYLELGFEDITHFSFAFKKMFGVAPSGVLGK